MIITHLSFATENFSQSAKILKASARRFGIKHSYIYTPSDIVLKELYRSYPNIMKQTRGAGYWLWKPFIIEDMMSRLPDGSIIIYSDCGTTFVNDPKYIISLLDSNDIVLFKQNHKQSAWTKRDCFVFLDADSEEYWNLDQLTAAFQLYKVCNKSREFISDLKKAMVDERILTDLPNVCGLPNLEDFRDHRHDQSILTIIAHRSDVAIVPDPSQFGSFLNSQSIILGYPQTFFHHRLRNTSAFRNIKRRLRRVYTGGSFFL